jgi:branched-subunit amino acid transport protein
MSPLWMALTLLACVVASWCLRVVLITVLPADRLPCRLREALPHVAPAVLAALIAGSLVHGDGLRGLVVPTPTHVALLVAGVVAWRFRSLAAPIAAALLVMLAAGLLPA